MICVGSENNSQFKEDVMENDESEEIIEHEMETNEVRSMTYIKNKEASQGVAGQLNESKLIALILYRLLKTDKATKFQLGTNLDGIGKFDDICIRLKHSDCEKTILILMQAKHKDYPSKGITNSDLYHKNSDFYLKEAFNSLLVEKGNVKNRDFHLYSIKRDDCVPYCIFYTNAVNKITNIKEVNSLCGMIKDLINTESGFVFQIDYNDDDIANITNNESQREDAIYFFENLYFFTNQRQEDGVGAELENEIIGQNFKDIKNFHVESDAVFLNFHKNVEKWWLKTGNVEYLTKSCNYLDIILNQVVNNAYLSILNYNSLNNLDLYPIQFSDESMASTNNMVKKIKFDNEQRTILRIITNSVILTSIKLKQYLTEYLKIKKYSLIDYEYLSKIRNVEFDILLKELENSDINILVVICNLSVKTIKENMYQIMKAFDKKIVLVTDKSHNIVAEDLVIEIENDFISGLLDISNQEKILENVITVQGLQLSLSKIIDNDARYIINADILMKILKNEKIEVGRSMDKKENDDEFIERKLMNASKTALDIELETLNDPIVVIAAEPGMGKSTLLTNKSMKLKKKYPKTWISRINLQDYSKDFFYRWQKQNISIDLKETMMLICKAEISMNEKFDINVDNNGKNNMELTNQGVDAISFMTLQVIAHSFNKRNILYILDGFDEVCPHYEKEAVEFITNLVNTIENDKGDVDDEIARHRIWITSRPYDSVRRTLEDFASPLFLTPLSRQEQHDFYKKFWQLDIHEDDLSNVKGFFKYMFDNRHQKVTLSSIPLRVMYNSALEYFRDEFKNEEIALDCWVLETGEKHFSKEQCEEAINLSGIPLHMKIYASHFVSVLKDNPKNQKWGLYVHTFEFYESFLETKLKKIYFVKKNRKNIYNPDIRLRYEEAREEFSEKHKKLAFFSFFHDVSDRYNKLKTIESMDIMIDEIMNGEEKMGLISGIYKGVPRFVHLAFAEYYTVEYIADLIKKKGKIPKLIIDFVINCLLDNIGLAIVFEQKLKHDVKLVKTLSTDANKKSVFEIIMKQAKTNYSLQKVLENDLKVTVEILLHSIDKELNRDNITAFVEYIGGKFFIYAAFLKYEDHIKYILKKISSIDTLIINNICNDIIKEMNNDIKIINKDTISKRLQELGFKNICDKLNTDNSNERNLPTN